APREGELGAALDGVRRRPHVAAFLGRSFVEIASLLQPAQSPAADARHELHEGVAAWRRCLVDADALATLLKNDIQSDVMEMNVNVPAAAAARERNEDIVPTRLAAAPREASGKIATREEVVERIDDIARKRSRIGMLDVREEAPQMLAHQPMQKGFRRS